MADGKRPHSTSRSAPSAARAPPGGCAATGFVPGVVYGGTGRTTRSRSRSNARVLRAVLVDGSALIDLKIDGGKTPPGDRQGPAARPRARRDHAHRPARGAPRREDPDARSRVELEGAEEAPGVKEGGVLEQVTPRAQHRGAADGHPRRASSSTCRGMEIAATMHLSEVTAPEGVDVPRRPRGDDHRHDRRPDRGRGARGDRGGDRAGRRGRRAERGGRGGRGRRRRRRPRAPPRRPRSPSEPLPPRRRRAGKVDWLVVGLGNPGDRYARTRHNVGFEVADAGGRSAGSCRRREEEVTPGLYTDGRTGPGGPRVGVLLPQTYMNDSGRVGRPGARRRSAWTSTTSWSSTTRSTSPSAEIEARVGGGLAGHNGLKAAQGRSRQRRTSTRIRVGVGRPDSTDPEIVSALRAGHVQRAGRRGARR